MRKYILGILLIMLMVVSCQPRYVFIPVFGSGNKDEATPYDVATPDGFADMLLSTGQVRLTADLEGVPGSAMAFDKDKTYVVDLNGHTLSVDTSSDSGWFYIKNGADVVFSDGALNVSCTPDNYTWSAVEAYEDTSLTLINVDFYSNVSGISPWANGFSFYAEDSTIKSDGAYGITTNASNPPFNTSFILKDTVIEVTGNEAGVGILLNIDCTLNMDNVQILSNWQGLVMRGGTATIKNSRIESTGYAQVEPNKNMYMYDSNWGSGNAVVYGALVVGNRGNGYDYPTEVTLENTDVIMNIQEGRNDDACRIYVSSAGERVDLNLDNDTYAQEIIDNEYYFGDNTWLSGVQLPVKE